MAAFGWRVNELETACVNWGCLPQSGSGKDGKIQKMDLIKALQNTYMDSLRSQGLLLPGWEWCHTRMESPMLAQASTGFKPEVWNDLLAATDVLAEVKEDGCRVLVSHFPGVGLEFFSRNRSVETFCMGSYRDQVYGLTGRDTEGLGLPPFVLDSEIISLNPTVNGRMPIENVLSAVVAMLGMNRADSHRMQAEAGYPLRFQCFDLLMWDGQSTMGLPLVERKKLLSEVMAKLQERASALNLPQLNWLIEVPYWVGGLDVKQQVFDSVIARGGEGLVLKRMDFPYSPFEARGGMSKAGFIKWKRTLSGSAGGEIDCFLDGRIQPGQGKHEGVAGSVGFSVYLVPEGTVYPVAMVSGLSDELRKALTSVNGKGEMCLNPAWLHRVAAVDGMDFSTVSGAMSHARILRWREGADAKSPAQCTLARSFIENLKL